ncbi:MAG: response regulator [Desulfobacterales bacterium]|nr:response regulator [Desulfobacterales bacterium]
MGALNFKHFSVKLQLILILVASSLVPSLIVGCVSYFFSKNLSIKYALNVEFIAEDVLKQLEDQLTKVEKTLIMISKEAVFSDVSVAMPDVEAISVSELLAEVIKTHKYFSKLIVTNNNGIILATETPRSNFIGNQFEINFEFENNNVVRGKFESDKSSNSILKGFWMHVPIFSLWDKSSPIGILSGFYSPKVLQDLIQKHSIDGQPQDKFRYIELLSNDGFLLTCPQVVNHTDKFAYNRIESLPELKNMLRKGSKRGKIESVKDDWGNKIIGFSKDVKSGLIILAYVDKFIVFRQIHTIRNFLFIFLSSIIILSVICALAVSKNFTIPLFNLIKGVRRISDGDLKYKVAVTTKNEFADLTNSFNKMTKELRKAFKTVSKKNKALKQAEKKYRQIFENAIEGIFQITLEGVIINANKSMAILFGYNSPSELIHSITNFADQCYLRPEEFDQLIAKVKKNKFFVGFESQFKRKNGSLFWGSKNIRLVFGENNTISHYEGSIIDITEYKKLRESEKERESAEAAAKAKSDFLANMSHEIRTPMNAIIGLTSLSLKTEVNAKQYDYLKKIEKSAQSLLGIINDILDFSKIEAGKLDMEYIPFNLEEVFFNISTLLGLKTDEKDLELLFDIDPTVPYGLIGDPLRLSQVLINLVSNAIKFTKKGQIIVRLERLASQVSDQVILKFSVIDTGIGMTKEQLDKLFKPFSQADSTTTRKFGGTGLGLMISKRLVEMMNGEIWVESEVGKGSKFSFTARFRKKVEEKAKKNTYPVDFKNIKVLVVDDNPTARELLVNALESFSFKVDQVASGKEAIDELEKLSSSNTYQMVFIDWKMPDMDGIEASRLIKLNEKLGKTPAILMVTAYGREEIKKKAEAVGIDAFLMKPVTKSLLFDTIMGVLGKEIIDESCVSRQKIEEIKGLSQIRGAKILLVEDNEINQQVASELLEQEGFFVTTAENGVEALEIIRSKAQYIRDNIAKIPFDIVLMDVQMPEMDGYETTEAIRKLEAEFHLSNIIKFQIPIIAMTAHAMTGEREKCLKAGMNDYVSKPIDTRQLFETIVRWIEPDKREVNLTKKIMKDVNIVNDLSEKITGIDIDSGLVRVGGNKKLYKDLLKSFLTNYSTKSEQIRVELDIANFDKAIILAHTLKGVAGNIGAQSVFLAAMELELAIKQNNKTAIDIYIDKLSEALLEVINSLEYWASRQDSVK